MKFDTEKLARCVEAIDRAAENLRDCSLDRAADCIADGFEQVARAMEEVCDILDDASEE